MNKICSIFFALALLVGSSGATFINPWAPAPAPAPFVNPWAPAPAPAPFVNPWAPAPAPAPSTGGFVNPWAPVPTGTGSGSLTGGAASGANPSDPASFNAATIQLTNAKRATDCAPAVTQDATLTAAAQKYAEKLAASGTFAHSPEAIAGQYGENLAMQCGATVVPSTAVDGWYNEKIYYSKAAPAINLAGTTMNGHYTALVWKATTKAGCGVATGANKCTYVVCNYGPPGNNPAPAELTANVGC